MSASRPQQKIFPHSIEAEQAVLCAMLINPDIRPDVRKTLRAQDFYRAAHGLLFPIIANDTLDIVAIYDEMIKRNIAERCGGKEYLITLTDVISTSAAWRHHAEIIKETARKRQFVSLSQAILDNIEHLSSSQIQEQIRQGLTAIDLKDRFGYRGGVDISNVYVAEKCFKEYTEYIGMLKQNRFITGIFEIDRRIRGVAGGEVLFIIARAGSFKTALLQNFLRNYIQHSAWGAAFFSIEMPVASLTERYHQIMQGCGGKDIEDIYVAAREGASLIRETLEQQFVEELKNLFIVATRVSVPDIISYTALIEKHYETRIGVIGIDYLGLMEGEGQGEYEIISKLARDCKNMAKLLGLPVVVIAQTSRRAGSGDIEISLDMGRGSGAIEESADFVLGLYQAEDEIICKILKNRKGSKGSRWKLDLDQENFRLGPEAWPWELPEKKKAWKEEEE